jgi:peptidoglycan/xylan/chitin deacetylase (PgdA/CDA1 family)
MNTVREIVAAAIRWSGTALLVRRVVARRRASILLYHDPSPQVLEAHLRYLAPRYNFITLDALVDAIVERRWASLPDRALVLTFDDAHRRNAELADVLIRYGVVPTIYACSQILATDRHFWFFETDDPEPLKPLPHGDRLERLSRSAGFSPSRDYPEDRHAMSVDEVELLRGAVDFASHTRFHPVLTTLGDDECATEIIRSKAELEALLGTPCRHFSYPNGDYGEREVELARKAGYASARSVDIGWADEHSDLFRLPILGTSDTASVTRLAADLSGIPGWIARARRGSYDGRHKGVTDTTAPAAEG